MDDYNKFDKDKMIGTNILPQWAKTTKPDMIQDD